MNEIMAEKFEKNKDEMVEKFLTKVNEQIRGMVYEVATAAQVSLDKNKKLIGKTSTQLKNALARFRMLNILNDGEIEKELKIVEKHMNVSKRDPKELQAALTRLRSEASMIGLEMRFPEGTRSTRQDFFAEDPIEDDPTMGLPIAARVTSRDI
jgi:hypothetical protein